MDNIVLLKQLLVLLAMMLVGVYSYKTKIIDENTYNHLSSLVVKVLNPFLMVSGVIGKTNRLSSEIITQNVYMVIFMYFMLFLIGFIYIKLINCQDNKSYLYRMLILLPNVGFMGIPIIKEVLGSEYIVLVAFYVLGFNIIAYTYGVNLSYKYGGRSGELKPKQILNTGTLFALTSVVIFYMNLQLPGPFVVFTNYMGEACIVVSMIVIGAFLAKMDLKTAFFCKDSIIFVGTFMLLVPLLMSLLAKNFQINSNVFVVFQIMCCMPIGSVTCMLAQEYGKNGAEAAKLVASTTVATVITAPLVFYFYNLIINI